MKHEAKANNLDPTLQSWTTESYNDVISECLRHSIYMAETGSQKNCSLIYVHE